jgi:hypothetical protein
MSTMLERIRNRRHVSRRNRAFDRALRQATSTAMRKELLDMASRFE